MAKTIAAEVQAGDRAVRVSSPDRVIYEATERTPEVTKLMVAQFFADVGDGLMRALRHRPTALERWTSGVRPGMKLATGPQDKDADAFYQKRVPKGAPDYLETATITFPSGRTADEICPTEIAVPVWCAHMGTLTFHPWPVRRDDVDRPDELRIDLDPQPGTSFTDAVRVAGVAGELLAELGLKGYPKTSGNRGVHIYVRIEPRWEFADVRHAAIGFGRELEKRDDGVTTAWWKEERGERIFVDFNQNTRDRTIASAYSLRPIPGAPVSTPMSWVVLAGVAKELLEELGIVGYPKTSGNRGVHVFVRIEPRWEFTDLRHAAIGFGRELARRDDGVTVDWWKEERGERIFIDFNQNCRDRTIASAYSLRPIVGAPVSTPLTWEELAEVTDPREFNLFTVPERLAASGDAWVTIDDTAYSLEPLLALYDELPGGEMPFPPDYPKMPGEPPRVQPSKKVEEHWDADGNWIGPS